MIYSLWDEAFGMKIEMATFPKAYPGIALSQITLKVTNIRVYKISLYIAPVMRHSYCHI